MSSFHFPTQDPIPRATLENMIESVRVFDCMRNEHRSKPRTLEEIAEFRKVESKYESFIPMLHDYIENLCQYRDCMRRLRADPNASQEVSSAPE